MFKNFKHISTSTYKVRSEKRLIKTGLFGGVVWEIGSGCKVPYFDCRCRLTRKCSIPCVVSHINRAYARGGSIYRTAGMFLCSSLIPLYVYMRESAI